MVGRRCDTATLVRGRSYTYRSVKYEHGTPVVINDKQLLRELEELHDEVTDGDGEVWEKPRFDINRNVPLPNDFKEISKVQRVSSKRDVKLRKIRRR